MLSGLESIEADRLIDHLREYAEAMTRDDERAASRLEKPMKSQVTEMLQRPAPMHTYAVSHQRLG